MEVRTDAGIHNLDKHRYEICGLAVQEQFIVSFISWFTCHVYIYVCVCVCNIHTYTCIYADM